MTVPYRGLNRRRLCRWSRLLAPGVLLVGFGGCIGPNPGFFVSTSAANATISALVNAVLNNLLLAGQG